MCQKPEREQKRGCDYGMIKETGSGGINFWLDVRALNFMLFK
jgi:hypothetical protein